MNHKSDSSVGNQAEKAVSRFSLMASLARWRLTSFVFLALLLVVSRYVDVRSLVSTGSQSSYIARVFISGVITEDHDRDELLKKILDDSKVAAVIVHINSPGGSVVGSEALYNRLLNISCKKHVVSVMGGMATSGGYMAALASDYIIARHGTITGSIGVLSQTFDVTGLMDKVGVRSNNVRSGELKDAISPFGKISAKGKENLQEMVCDSYEYFTALLSKHRGLSAEQVKERATGRLYTGSQAVKASLVDQIGGEEEALEWLEAKKIKFPVKTLSVERKKRSIEEFMSGSIFGNFFDSLFNFLSATFFNY